MLFTIRLARAIPVLLLLPQAVLPNTLLLMKKLILIIRPEQAMLAVSSIRAKAKALLGLPILNLPLPPGNTRDEPLQIGIGPWIITAIQTIICTLVLEATLCIQVLVAILPTIIIHTTPTWLRVRMAVPHMGTPQ